MGNQLENYLGTAGLDPADIQIGEYMYPGPSRDRLVAAILSGEKTSTASLLEEYRRNAEPLPQIGELEAVVDSEGQPVCLTSNIRVEVERFADVSDHHAAAEGEGFIDADTWRQAHREFWTSAEFVSELGAPVITINDDTLVVLVTMKVIARL